MADSPRTESYPIPAKFDVPVRFDADRIATSLAGFAAGELPSIPVVEVRV